MTKSKKPGRGLPDLTMNLLVPRLLAEGSPFLTALCSDLTLIAMKDMNYQPILKEDVLPTNLQEKFRFWLTTGTRQIKSHLFLLLIASLFNVQAFAQNGAALNFDGVNDYVTLGNSTALKPTTFLTLELWAYRADWTSVVPTPTVQKRIASVTEGGGYSMYVDQRNGGNTIEGIVNRNSAYGTVTTSAASLTAGWHHFALTYDGRYTKLYVDGTLADSDDAGANYPIHYSTTTNSFIIGSEAGSASTPEVDSYFNGSIDEVRIWNVARTATEVAANRNCELTGTETGLLAYYHFNQGSAGANNASETTLPDATTNGQHGTLTNFDLTGTSSNWIQSGGVVSGVACSSASASVDTVEPSASNLKASGELSPQNCTVRITGLGTGESFVFTGPKGYAFSNVFRKSVQQQGIVAEGVKIAGTYLLTVRLGNKVVSYTIEIVGAGCN